MEHGTLEFEPPLTGREDELNTLCSLLEDGKAGSGSTVFVSGEAGIGKTRLVEETLDTARSNDMKIIQGRCVAESLEPLSPIKEAFREADQYHLIADNPPPKVLSAYLTNNAEILIAKAERDETELDADIFASMLKGVSNFVSDSLSMMGEGEKEGVSGIAYKGYNILMETRGDISLILVIEGEENEFLIDDIHEVLDDISDMTEDLDPDEYGDPELNQKMSWFIDSGKYEGKYLVDDSKLKRENLFDNVLKGIRREASKHPVVMFIDDLQWADPSTLSLLHYLSRNIKNDPILLVGAYRPEDLVQKWDGEVHQLKSTLRNMRHEDLYEEIELDRLSKTDLITLLQDMLGEAELSAKFYDRAYRESEGNPYFLIEFIRHMIDNGHMVKRDDVWSVGAPLDHAEVPSRVYDMVEKRLDRLSDEQRRILEFASVIGTEFGSSIIEEGLDYKRKVLLSELSDLEKIHGLISSGEDGYTFDHKKVREALHDNLNEELKEEYHRAIAEYYQQRYEEGEEDILGKMIHHFYEAKDERAIDYLFEAGRSAQERYANEEAERFFSNALELIPGSNTEDILYIHDKLGDLCKLKGEYETALEHYRRAIEGKKDDEKKAVLYGKIADLYGNMGEHERAIGSVDKGMKLDPSQPCDLLKTKGWVLLRKGDFDKAKKVFLKEYENAKTRGADGNLAQALHDIGAVYFRKGQSEEALKHFNRAVEKWKDIDDLKGLSTSLNNIGIIYYYQSDFDKALEYHKRSLDIKEKIEDQRGVAISLNNIGAIYKNKGEFQKALRCYEDSLGILDKVGDKLGVVKSLHNIGTIHHHLGEYDKALEFYRRSLRMCEDIEDEKLMLNIRSSLNEIFIAQGKVELAIEHGKKVLERIEVDGSAEEGVARRVMGVGYRERGDLERAEKEFRRAREILDETDNKMEFTKVLYELALLFKKKGERGKFKGHMNAALKNFQEMGMGWWAEKAEVALTEE